MIRKVLLLVALLCLLPASVAVASPTGVAITATADRVTVGQSVTYTGSYAVCDRPPCREQIVVFGPGYSRLGTVLKEGNEVTVVWAKTGTFTVQFRVTASNGTNGRTQAQTATVVTP